MALLLFIHSVQFYTYSDKSIFYIDHFRSVAYSTSAILFSMSESILFVNMYIKFRYQAELEKRICQIIADIGNIVKKVHSYIHNFTRVGQK